MCLWLLVLFFFFFNDTATTEIYTLSLHDALPISVMQINKAHSARVDPGMFLCQRNRSEEHTSELQSLAYLVCRLLLEKTRSQTESTSWRKDARTSPAVRVALGRG